MGSAHTRVLTDSAGSFLVEVPVTKGHLVASGSGCAAESYVDGPSPAAIASATVDGQYDPHGLSNTGAEVRVVAALAGIMLFAGVILVVHGRRRRS